MKFIDYLKIKRDSNKYAGSSRHLKKDLDVLKVVNMRLLVLVAIILSLGILLLGRLFQIQIIDADYYAELVRRKQSAPITQETMRGEILDSNGNVIVSNKPRNIITYRSTSLGSNARWELAKSFSKIYKIEDDLKERELKDLYLFLNNYGQNLVSNSEIKEKNLTSSEIDALKYERITNEMLEGLSVEDKEAFKIELRMRNQAMGNPAVVIDNATNEDISYLVEHMDIFPGFSWTTTWDRAYTGMSGLETIVGKVNDISAEKLQYMLAKGYTLNDKVGVSGLEYTYERYLSGIKSIYETDNQTGNLNQTADGRRGYDVVMSLDMDFQSKVEAAAFGHWNLYKDAKGRDLMNGIDLVVSNPNTGEIYSVVGIRKDSEGELYNDPQVVFHQAFPVGSVVKGATVYMGLEEGVIKPGEVIIDQPLVIKGTSPRVSWKNLGPVTNLTALQKSSNIYMFMIAIRLGGANYIPNDSLYFSKPIDETFALMRSYFSQFGLGVNTLVDYPIELNGYKGTSQNGGLLLEFSIGQYDNYNALQLNQYISTIANGGYRVKPYLVSEVVDPETNTVIYKNEPQILNTLSGTDNLNLVREGLRLCASQGDCGRISQLPYSSGAKTGTAQYTENGIKMLNNAFVGFAPFENPEVAVSCINSGAFRQENNNNVNLCSILSSVVIDLYMNSN